MAYPEKQYQRQETAKEYTTIYTLDATDEMVVKQEDGMLGYISAGQFATTGSNVFTSGQTINGNLTINGDINANQFLVTTTSVTHYTASTNFGLDNGDTHTFTGSVYISGSEQLKGNLIVSGNVYISGTTEFGGDLIPKTARGATIGTLERPFRDIFLQSASINIASDIPGGKNAAISNADGNVTITAAGFQLKSGSFVAFEISETARTIIRVPNIPAGDIGAVSIIGNSSGAYQPVINPSGMLHITSNDNEAARVTVDGFGSNIGAIFVGRHARGTAANPTPTLSGDILARFSGLGYSTSSYFPIIGGVPTSLEFQATENYSTSGAGSRAAFYTYANGAVNRTLSAVIDANGLFVSGAFTASLAEGYAWVGGNNNRTKLIPTASFATTGSNTFIGNQTITGSLTLSSGSALNINDGFYVEGNRQFNYGQWASLQTQTGSANTAYAMKLDTQTDGLSGFYVGNNVSGFPTRIYAQNTGLYNLQFSAQLHTTANQAVDFSVWFAMTGSNIANSNTDFSIEKIAGGGFQVAALNFLTPISSGSYVELYWSKTTAQGELQAKGVQSSPSRPVTPSLIVTVTQVA
jgi:hypothetical protein